MILKRMAFLILNQSAAALSTRECRNEGNGAAGIQASELAERATAARSGRLAEAN